MCQVTMWPACLVCSRNSSQARSKLRPKNIRRVWQRQRRHWELRRRDYTDSVTAVPLAMPATPPRQRMVPLVTLFGPTRDFGQQLGRCEERYLTAQSRLLNIEFVVIFRIRHTHYKSCDNIPVAILLPPMLFEGESSSATPASSQVYQSTCEQVCLELELSRMLMRIDYHGFLST